jgi:hypothetical protein
MKQLNNIALVIWERKLGLVNRLCVFCFIVVAIFTWLTLASGFSWGFAIYDGLFMVVTGYILYRRDKIVKHLNELKGR